MAAYLQDLLGQKLTAVIAGVKDAGMVEQWAEGATAPDDDATARLRTAYHAARLLRQAESAALVRSWFMGMNPLLDDRSPALVIATDPVAVLDAARALVASG